MSGQQVQVTWEDQKNINTFSKMNTRRHELEGLIAGTKKDLEDLEDASAELVIADEEDDGGSGGGGVRLRVGTAFLHVPKEEAEERVEALSGEAKERLGHLQEEAGGVETKLAELKATLYARLGKGNINLEE